MSIKATKCCSELVVLQNLLNLVLNTKEKS